MWNSSGPPAMRVAIELLRNAGYLRVMFDRDVRTREYELVASPIQGQPLSVRVPYEAMQRADIHGTEREFGLVIARMVETQARDVGLASRVRPVAEDDGPQNNLVEAMQILVGRGYDGTVQPPEVTAFSVAMHGSTMYAPSQASALTVTLRMRGAPTHTLTLYAPELAMPALPLADMLDARYRESQGMPAFRQRSDIKQHARSSPLEAKVRALEDEKAQLTEEVARLQKIIDTLQADSGRRLSRQVRIRKNENG